MTDNVVWHPGLVGSEDRQGLTGGVGVTVWMTGLSGSGKSTIARLVEKKLIALGRLAYVLDGDNLRHGLNSDLGFSDQDRTENVRRVGHVARLFADAGLVVLVPVISPFASDRARVRSEHAASGVDFLEVFVDTPLEVCEERDPKNLYARARSGEVKGMTGVDSPYEAPVTPDLRLDGVSSSADDLAESLLSLLLGA